MHRLLHLLRRLAYALPAPHGPLTEYQELSQQAALLRLDAALAPRRNPDLQRRLAVLEARLRLLAPAQQEPPLGPAAVWRRTVRQYRAQALPPA
ncbi:hypothetical protein [Streptomyces sp. NPDC001380]|uniref:hypothetical protein n=1 Tax=Streptomyces sp. NPDC001380 TaxID=3364566 RepID=UPI003697B618